MADRPFVRIYHDDLMRDYPGVYADDAALALFVRLLVIVDRMFPTRPELPRSARGRGLALLRKTGLLVEVAANQFTLKGYEKERQSRQDAARNAAAVRWHSASIAEGRPSTNTSTNPSSISINEDALRSAREKKGPRTGLEPIASIMPRTIR